MPFSLHILFALAALAFVSAAVVLGAGQGFATATPGGVAICRIDNQPCGPSDRADFQRAMTR